jgi:2-methylcitrate dehydratase PrpD
MNDITRTLARFVVDSTPDAVPRPLYHEATRALVNWMGCAIGSAQKRTPTTRPRIAPASAVGINNHVFGCHDINGSWGCVCLVLPAGRLQTVAASAIASHEPG